MTTTSPLPAQHLVHCLDAVARGDKAALAELYQRTSAKLFGVCLRILAERSEAEEVLQEVYMTVWRKAGLYEPARASAIAWLVAIARNKALDRLRSSRVQRSAAPVEALEAVADAAPSALAALEDDDERRRLMACLDLLEADQQAAIRQAFFDGATYEELSRRRSVPLGTMKSWIRRGLLKLRGCLGA